MMDGRYNPQRAGYYNTPYSSNYAYHSEDEDDFEPEYHDRRRSVEEKAVANEKGKQKESMSSTSSQAQFAATALVSGAVVAGAIFGYQAVRRQERVKDLKSGIPEVGEGNKVRFALCP
jgi:hypothetical protein